MPLRLSVLTRYWSTTHSKRGTGAESIVKRFCGNIFKRQEVVVDERGSVFGEFHLFDTPIERHIWGLDELQFYRIPVGIRR